MIKKIVAIILAGILCTSVVAYAVTDVDDMKKKQEELQSQNEELKNKIKNNNGEISEKETKKQELLTQLSAINSKIEESSNKLTDLENQIEKKQASIDATDIKIKESQKLLKSRVKSIYMAGDASNLEIILGAKDFTDFLDKLELVQSISEHDSKLIDKLRGQMKSIALEKSELLGAKKQEESQKKALGDNQVEYETFVSDNQEVLDVLYVDTDKANDKIHNNTEEMKKIDSEIENYYAEQKKIAEEAKKKAEEEAKKKEEENNNIGGGATDTTDEKPTTGGRMWPTPGFTWLSSEWHEDRETYAHGGIDIAGSGIMWTKIVAPDNGVVAIASETCTHNYGKEVGCGCGGNFGNWVMLDYGGGYSNIFAHMSSVSVYAGQTVKKGQVLGYVGTTGGSTGPHLHFEARYYNERYNPMNDF